MEMEEDNKRADSHQGDSTTDTEFFVAIDPSQPLTKDWNELSAQEKSTLAETLFKPQLLNTDLTYRRLTLVKYKGSVGFGISFKDTTSATLGVGAMRKKGMVPLARQYGLERMNMGPIPHSATDEDVQEFLDTTLPGSKVIGRHRDRHTQVEKASYNIQVPSNLKHNLKRMKTFGDMSHIFFNITHAVRCPVCLSSDHTKFSHACKTKCYKCGEEHKAVDCKSINNTCQLCKSTHNNRPCPKVLKRLQIVGQPDRHADRPSSQGNSWLSGPPSSFVSSHTVSSDLAQTVASLKVQLAALRK